MYVCLLCIKPYYRLNEISHLLPPLSAGMPNIFLSRHHARAQATEILAFWPDNHHNPVPLALIFPSPVSHLTGACILLQEFYHAKILCAVSENTLLRGLHRVLIVCIDSSSNYTSDILRITSQPNDRFFVRQHVQLHRVFLMREYAIRHSACQSAVCPQSSVL